jgi:hypothetical protein
MCILGADISIALVTRGYTRGTVRLCYTVYVVPFAIPAHASFQHIVAWLVEFLQRLAMHTCKLDSLRVVGTLPRP